VFDLHIEPLDNNAWNGFHYNTSFQSKSNQVLFIWLLPIMSCRAQGDSSGCWCREGGNGARRQSKYTTMMDAMVSGAVWGSKWWRVAKPLADLMWEQEENVRCATDVIHSRSSLEKMSWVDCWEAEKDHENTTRTLTRIQPFLGLCWNGMEAVGWLQIVEFFLCEHVLWGSLCRAVWLMEI
jgi:hypothetical protein